MSPPQPPAGIQPGKVARTLLRVLSALYLAGLAAFCVAERKVLFAWPAGIVTGNLLASAIWAPLAVIHLDRLARRHHRAHLALLREQHREHLRAISEIRQPSARGTIL